MAANHKDNNIVAELRSKVKRLAEFHELQKEKNKALSTKVEDLNKEIAILKQDKETLDSEKEKLQLAKAFAEASGGTHDAKINLNRIVREIDKCIALLNK